MQQPTSIRMSDELRDALKSLALIEHRSFNGLIIHILTEYCEKQKED